MSKLKAPLLFAGICCVFSMFIGLLNSVPFFTLLIRGLITGIITGTFVFSAAIVLKKTLPDLFEKKIEPAGSTVSSGTNVNITLDETLESPMTERAVDPETGTGLSTDTAASVDEKAPSTAPDNAIVGAPINNEDNSVVMNDSAAVSGKTDSIADGDRPVVDEVGDLPDMDAFDAADIRQMSEQGETVAANVSGLSMDEMQLPAADTKIMAEAIRTMLKSGE
ncbi:MAG: hypothetical protein ACTTJ7_01255 [Treponema sp.]